MFGAEADFLDAVRSKVAKLIQIEDIFEEYAHSIDRERASEILDLYEQYERFEYDKDYFNKAIEEV